MTERPAAPCLDGAAPGPQGTQAMKLGKIFNQNNRSNGVKQVDTQLNECVQKLMADVRPPMSDRRANKRAPYFCPATLSLDCDEENVLLPAFVRDISEVGIGLLHSTPIEPGDLTAKFVLRSLETVVLRVSLRWCMPCGEYWYISGGEFIQDCK